MVETKKEKKNGLFEDEGNQKPFAPHEETKRELTPVREAEGEGWQRDKRPLIYAFTGDVNPAIERRAEAMGFKKAFAVFKREQIEEILMEIEQRDIQLENIF